MEAKVGPVNAWHAHAQFVLLCCTLCCAGYVSLPLSPAGLVVAGEGGRSALHLQVALLDPHRNFQTFDYVVFLYFGRVLIHLCRTAILKALSDAEALKKPSVSSETASALMLLLLLPWPSLPCVTVGLQVRHLFADVLDEKTEILKQQEKHMLQHLAKYSQHYNANLYEQ
jgi:hypothetical protein